MKTESKNLEKIIEYLKSFRRAVLAYSGGLDSTLLLYLLKQANVKKLVAATAVSGIFPCEETETARKNAEKIGVEFVEFNMDILSDSKFISNTPDRCFYCKHRMFQKIKGIAEQKKIKNILDASNKSDISDYRPGIRAAKELGMISPFIETGCTKEDIQYFSSKVGIDKWVENQTVCLASRIPYGVSITKENLNMISRAEEYLKTFGLKNLRVRSDGATARIEVNEKDIDRMINKKKRQKICDELKDIGFKFVSLDMEGFQTGKLNRLVKNE